MRKQLRPLRASARALKGTALACVAEARWARRPDTRPHPLPAPLIVSLTSHPPRFATLALSLKCLLSQSVKPDRVILWLTPEEQKLLPRGIWRMRGLSIQSAPAIGSFKKIIPALSRHSDGFIVTADDDVFYHYTWLEELVAAYDPSKRDIPCHRAHRISLAGARTPAPYAQWRLLAHPEASGLVFPTGVGGALYAPGSLHSEVRDAALFTTLCPTSDDAWLYWMARRAGWRFSKIGPREHFTPWPGSQGVALMHANAGAEARNDQQIAALTTHFGFASDPPQARQKAAARW